MCVCVCWVGVGFTPTYYQSPLEERSCSRHTHIESSPEIAAGRADSFLRKVRSLLLVRFRGSQRGPRRGYYSGIRGAPNRARPAFWGHILMRNTKNDVFGNTKNAKIFLRRRYGAGVKNKVSDRRYMASEINGKVGFLRVHRRYTSAFFASFGPLFLGFPGQILRRGTNIEHF